MNLFHVAKPHSVFCIKLLHTVNTYGETEISIQIKRRIWTWIGHTLRKGNEAIEREVLDWNPQGKRRRGRPKQMWRRSVHNEALEKGKSWSEVKRMAEIGPDGDVLLTPYVPQGITGIDDDDDDVVNT
jgi:hypothetical protein